MIPRYTLKEMGYLWSEQAKFQSWLDVEIAVCEAWAKYGKIPAKDLAIIKKKAKFDVREIENIEQEVRHDVIAFLTDVATHVGKSSRYIHMGLTSSDVLDTAMALRLVKACDIIIEDLQDFIKTLKKVALKHKMTLMIGRTHNIHAEPITFGLKVLIWYFEMKRNLERLLTAKKDIAVGKLSGAVGNYAHIPPHIESYALKKLKLKRAEAANQIIQRDRYAYLMSVLAIIAGTIEKIATEIRNLQHTEILEVEEPFAKGQKGSSAMPHKRNPVICEQLCGLARLVRTNTFASYENIALWHERDISHSSVERIIIPDNLILINYMLNKIDWVIENLNVYPENMLRNLNHLKGLVFSQQVLLALVHKGLTREEAYKIVQSIAMKIWKDKKEDFKTLLKKDNIVKKYFADKEIDDIFDYGYFLKNIDEIYKRI
ncbi:MAG: adenylosuccinate lyase [Candidatus Goldbacteria bacterium]|nr:adenylosuccinate lyase [Candidatus Goldiibacteriota bacterium]